MTMQRTYDWIMKRLDEGRTVYATNYLQSIKITPKNRDLVRLHNGHVEVARGKRWASVMGCKITAV